MSIADLEQQRQQAEERLHAAVRALAPKHVGGEWEEYHQAYTALKSLERTIAKLKNEPYARLFDFPLVWDIGAPSPHLFQNDYHVFLLFYLNAEAVLPNTLAITTLPTEGSGADARENIAVVEFYDCVTTRMGDPNDEVFQGHPLARSGGEPYTAQVVENSSWVHELEHINSIHTNYQPDSWRKVQHYIFWFHDTTFECIARSFEIQVYQAQLPQLFPLIYQRLYN